jgi:hypothetical protein
MKKCNCGRDLVGKYKSCEKCRISQRKRNNKRYEILKKNGKCNCGNNCEYNYLKKKHFVKCERCRDVVRKRAILLNTAGLCRCGAKCEINKNTQKYKLHCEGCLSKRNKFYHERHNDGICACGKNCNINPYTDTYFWLCDDCRIIGAFKHNVSKIEIANTENEVQKLLTHN